MAGICFLIDRTLDIGIQNVFQFFVLFVGTEWTGTGTWTGLRERERERERERDYPMCLSGSLTNKRHSLSVK